MAMRELGYDEPVRACDACVHTIRRCRMDAAAVACFKRAAAAGPKDADAHYNLGLALQETGNLAGAIASYRRVVELEPRHAGEALAAVTDISREF
jgi:tetratricopeptide (TPR) repeat protein